MRGDEERWLGDYGDSYANRQVTADLIEDALRVFGFVLEHTGEVASVIDVGAGLGAYLKAFHRIRPDISLAALDINATMARALRSWVPEVYCESVLDWQPQKTYDLVIANGLLSAVGASILDQTYERLYAAAGHWILVMDYYSPDPCANGVLHARDFVGEMVKAKDLTLVIEADCDPQPVTNCWVPLRWSLLEKAA